MTPDQMREGISEVIDRRLAGSMNPTLTRKWKSELKALTMPSNLTALASISFNPSQLGDLAVYATMKVRRIAAHMAGTGRVDPYTETLVKNAAAVSTDGTLKNATMNASLSTARASAVMLPTRRHGSEGTASTQACSTRAALVALGAGERVGKFGFKINQDHPAIAAILGKGVLA